MISPGCCVGGPVRLDAHARCRPCGRSSPGSGPPGGSPRRRRAARSSSAGSSLSMTERCSVGDDVSTGSSKSVMTRSTCSHEASSTPWRWTTASLSSSPVPSSRTSAPTNASAPGPSTATVPSAARLTRYWRPSRSPNVTRPGNPTSGPSSGGDRRAELGRFHIHPSSLLHHGLGAIGRDRSQRTASTDWSYSTLTTTAVRRVSSARCDRAAATHSTVIRSDVAANASGGCSLAAPTFHGDPPAAQRARRRRRHSSNSPVANPTEATPPSAHGSGDDDVGSGVEALIDGDGTSRNGGDGAIGDGSVTTMGGTGSSATGVEGTTAASTVAAVSAAGGASTGGAATSTGGGGAATAGPGRTGRRSTVPIGMLLGSASWL